MLGLEKYKKSTIVIHAGIGILTLIIVSLLCGYAAINADRMIVTSGGVVMISFFILPFAISFSRGSSQPRDRAWVFCIAGRFFTS